MAKQPTMKRKDIPVLRIESSGCTPFVRIKPIRGSVVMLNTHQEGMIEKSAVVVIDPRQFWKCRYCDVDTHGWECRRDNATLFLSEYEFEHIFGIIEVAGNGVEKYHEPERRDAP